jgi:glycine dehydrogenase subunit 2
MPGEDGLPELEALKAALTEKTAGIFITNPEDTGIFNSKIDEYVEAAHKVGALCSYDQANANGMLGIARAKEVGFDLCHFNVHKTFSAPHGCMGPAMGAIGVVEHLSKYLPIPKVEFDGRKYYLDYNRPHSIGKVRSFFGNAQLVVKAYMWIMQLGADGLREVAECSVLNNNYLEKKIRTVPGVEVYYAEGKHRLEQVRYSWRKLTEDTGVTTDDVSRRLVDYGLQHYHTSHHPYVVPEPFTLEPCESYSKEDIDEYAAVFRQVAKEAYDKPDLLQNSPFNAPIHRVKGPAINDSERIAVTWRQWMKKRNQTNRQC